ncbi:phage late control D family protein [Stenotrophomonas rhizophila]|uniref:phage late control D family protein n=1 Tax=Stenotrophomonas rhizophila TaxID=216778 RepID=UPI003515B5F7
MAVSYPVPAWRVVLDGRDLTDRIAPRLLDLTLTESRGEEADQLDLRIHDHDGRMALPRRGVTLQVALGWRGSGLVNKGSFIVDDVEHSGSPDIISIRARSADLTGAMRNRRERSWHATTLGEILGAIAGDHSLKTAIAPALSAIQVPHLDQANESDVNLLTRLGKRFDAVATVKAGTLVFSPIGSGTTPSGITLPAATITRASGDQHRYIAGDRDKYTGVRAYWNDHKAARRKSVLVGKSTNEKKMQSTFATEAEARQRATAELQRSDRGAATLSISLALGRADMYPEQSINVSGFKPEIDGDDWLVSRTTHTITGDGGFTTSVEMEIAAGAARPSK